MTKKDLDQFIKDISKVINKQSKKIDSLEKLIKQAKPIAPVSYKQQVEECYVTAVLSKENVGLSKEQIDRKMKGVENKIRAIMIEHTIQSLTAIMKK